MNCQRRSITASLRTSGGSKPSMLNDLGILSHNRERRTLALSVMIVRELLSNDSNKRWTAAAPIRDLKGMRLTPDATLEDAPPLDVPMSPPT